MWLKHARKTAAGSTKSLLLFKACTTNEPLLLPVLWSSVRPSAGLRRVGWEGRRARGGEAVAKLLGFCVSELPLLSGGPRKKHTHTHGILMPS